jgi:hypothetical protein
MPAFALLLMLRAVAQPVEYLSPHSFSGIPPRVLDQLERLRCRIPQALEAERPNNIIRGRFIKAGQTTWAALCSMDGRSRIVILSTHGRKIATDVAPGLDSDYRLLLVANPGRIRAADRALGNAEPLPALDHDGIDDIITGKASVILYFHRGRWLELAGSD